MSNQGHTYHARSPSDSGRGSSQRWDGILTAEQLNHHRSKGLPLAFCPVQIGWVSAAASQDDCPVVRADEPSAPLSWSVSRPLGAFTMRGWTEADAPVYRRLLDDADLWRYMPEAWPGAIDAEMARDLITISNAVAHHEVWAILRDDVPLGQVRFAFADHGRDRSTAEISYWFGRAYWGQGWGRRVVRKASAQAFKDHPALRRIVAHVHPDDHASAKVLEAAGYARCGQRDDGWLVFEITA